ncbi:MAG: hypothetical protein ABWW69_02335 [Pyrodictiaceae archaeon]
MADGTSLATVIAEWAPRLWQAKLAGLVVLLIALSYYVGREKGKLAKLATFLDPSYKEGWRTITSGLLDSILAQWYNGDLAAKASILSLIGLHAVLAILVALHTPIIALVAWSALTLGSVNTWLLNLVALTIGYWRSLGVVLGSTTLLFLVLVAITDEIRGRGIRPLLVLVAATSSFGVASRLLNSTLLLHIHVVLGYALIAYLVFSTTGVHWLKALTIPVYKMSMPIAQRSRRSISPIRGAA